VPHIRAREGMGFGEEADPDYYSAENLVNMELKPGEFFLFNEKTLHHSEANRSDRRRMGMSVRVTIPIVKNQARRSSVASQPCRHAGAGRRLYGG
jgi:Phytanoyl-CoA dioxygenase (PhyH).